MKNAETFVSSEARGIISSFFILHFSFKLGALTWTCTTNFRLRRAACRADYTLRAGIG